MDHTRLLEVLVALCGIAVLASILWMLLFSSGYIQRQKLKRIEKRARLDPEEFYGQFYAQSTIPKTIVISALSEIAKATEVDKELIRPTDRFDRELAPAKGWEQLDDGSLDLITYVQKLGHTAPKPDFQNIHTVNDYIQLVATVTQQRAS
jgi:hypothetical protein